MTTHTTITDSILDGPHGPLPARVYAPQDAAGPGLVWVHGGGFAAGDLDMPEADWVARRFAAHGIAVVSVGYRLAPPLSADVTDRADTDGVHYPVASQEVAFAFTWAQSSPLEAGAWSLGGTSAGGNLAAGATLLLRHDERALPALVVLAYPTVHAVQPAPDAALRRALDENPEADRFGPDVVRGMYENYLGGSIARADIMTVPGNATAAELTGFPPTVIVNAEVDELSVSGEAFADTLRAAHVPVDVTTEPGTQHGYLNRPEEPAASTSVQRLARRILATRTDSGRRFARNEMSPGPLHTGTS